MKRTKLLLISALLATAAVSGAAAAQAIPGILYFRTFYSDATLTEQVGFYRDQCVNGRVTASPVNGTTSPYYTLERVGECRYPGGHLD